MKTRKMTALLLAGAMFLGGGFAVPQTVKAADNPVSSRVQTLIEGMSVRQKITQMMMPDFRFWDEDLTDDKEKVGVTELNGQIQKIVEDYDFGGVILFAQNVTGTEQTLNLTKQYQAAATKENGIPLLIGIDQEGGSVYRLGTGTALPGNMAVGATGSEDYAKKAGQIIGRELSSLGINCNFAPAVDVNNNPNNPVIGLRSFSDDPQTVAKLGVAMIEGMNEYNIATSAKHFLGHGDTATDSHVGLPVVDKSREELEKMELIPFRAAMAAGSDMFMTAHIIYPQIDNTKVISEKNGEEVSIPATLSKKILTDLVRNDMKYDGILITDAMNMAGVSENFGQVEASIMAIQAGIDILLMPCQLYNLEELNDLDTIIDGIEQAVAEGKITEDRLNESCQRILSLKERRGILDYDASKLTKENALAQVGSAENRAIEREMSTAAVTVVKNQNNVLPLSLNENSKVLFLAPYANELPCLAMGWTRARQALIAPKGAECKTIRFNKESTVATEEIANALKWADTVIVNSEVSSANGMKMSSWLTKFPTDISAYCKQNNKKSIILSVDKPYDVQHYADADAVLAVYGCKGSSADPTEVLTEGITSTDVAFGPNITAGVEVALGVTGASGKLPVQINEFKEDTGTYTDKVIYNRGFGITYDALEAPYQKAVEMISQIGEVALTPECENKINAAMEYYNTLDDENKAMVDYPSLLQSMIQLQALKMDKANSDAQKIQEALNQSNANAAQLQTQLAEAQAQAQASAAAAEQAKKELEEYKAASAANPKITAKKKYTVKKGKTVKMKATVSDNSKLTYKSANKKIAKVSSKGVIKGVKKGNTTITIKSASGAKKKVKVVVK